MGLFLGADRPDTHTSRTFRYIRVRLCSITLRSWRLLHRTAVGCFDFPERMVELISLHGAYLENNVVVQFGPVWCVGSFDNLTAHT